MPIPKSYPALSDDAKVVAGGFFAFTTELSFQMQESRPTARAQKALDELVEKGIIWREPCNRFGGVRYKPLFDCKPYAQWFWKNGKKGEWPIAEPIKSQPAA